MTDDQMPDNSRDSRSEFTLRVGPVEIRLRADPLENIVQTTPLDAIVSSDDSVLSMGGGVSAVIAKLAGAKIRDEITSDGPLPVGSLAITSGGNLAVRYIFHAVTVDWVNQVMPTERTIRQLLREILSRCEALRIARIAIPALATGAAGLSPTVSATIIARTLHEHALNPTVLQSVILPIPDAPVRQAFARELAMPMLEEAAAVFDSEPRFSQARARTLEPGSERHREAEALEEQATPPTLPLEETTAAPTLLASSTSTRPLLNGRFVLLEEIGRGGMAVVYLSWDLVLRRTVAIKMLKPELAESESLIREAAVALDLTHQRIVRVYHFEPGGVESEAFMVMEYLPWPSGEKWIADAGANLLPVGSVVNVGVSICDALAYAHSRHVLHLDIKPSNIFVEPGGEDAKLGDFGLARVSSTGGSVLQLKAAGTPAYMAPEQRTRGGSVSQATDIFQLAATLWDLLTGGPPDPDQPRLSGFEPARLRLISALDEALTPEPANRPSAARLREIVEWAA
jgi:O-acetyl-ADP-ribose deacetylase (regulator of RNase III)